MMRSVGRCKECSDQKGDVEEVEEAGDVAEEITEGEGEGEEDVEDSTIITDLTQTITQMTFK